MDWLGLFFEGVSGLLSTHGEVIAVLMVPPLLAGAFLGRLQGKREARFALQALRSDRDAAIRERKVEEERSGRLAAELEKEAGELARADQAAIDTKHRFSRLRAELDIAEERVKEAEQKIATLRTIFADNIWRKDWSDKRAVNGGGERAFGASAIPIIAVGNLKGGVGKTTIAGNIGAFLAARANASPDLKPVLFVDLDFQGSLSATMLYEAGLGPNLSQTDRVDYRVRDLFREGLPAADKLRMAQQFTRNEINRSSFYTCDFPAFRHEDELLYEWALQVGERSDIRLRLAEFLSSRDVQEHFGAVVMDLPPRTTTFAVNALCAATDLIIPARTDQLSVTTIPRFAGQLSAERKLLWPQLRICGVVGTMTQFFEPSDADVNALAIARGAAEEKWDAPQPPIADLGTIPAKASISAHAGQQFQYFIRSDGTPHPPHDIFESFGHRVLACLSRRPA